MPIPVYGITSQKDLGESIWGKAKNNVYVVADGGSGQYQGVRNYREYHPGIYKACGIVTSHSKARTDDR